MKLQARSRLKATAISQQQVTELEQAGYEVEDMGRVYGPGFHGQYRWVNGSDFQDHDTSDSVGDAWLEAWHHHQSKDKELA